LLLLLRLKPKPNVLSFYFGSVPVPFFTFFKKRFKKKVKKPLNPFPRTGFRLKTFKPKNPLTLKP